MTRNSLTSQPAEVTVEARRARIAVGVLFFTNGALIANLLPRYPEIKAALHLTNAAFGTAVAAYPLGALIAGLTAGYFVRWYRSSRVAVVATLVGALGVVLTGLAPTWFVLSLTLFVAGAMDSIADVAQNSHGLRVQRLHGRSIINSFHAIWSMGAVIGGAVGASAAQLGVPLLLQLSLSAAVLGAAALFCARWLLPGAEPDASSSGVAAVAHADDGSIGSASGVPRFAGRVGVLLVLVVIAAAGAVIEDSGGSWSAIYLADDLSATAFTAGLGFIAMQAMQFIGRLLGDTMIDRFGQRAVTLSSGLLVVAGMGTALAAPTIVGTIVGFGIAGFGAATLIPTAMQNADALPWLRPGTGLAIVGWLLRIGFLLSPPLVGAIADISALRYGLLVVPSAGLLVVLAARGLPARASERH